MRGFLKSVAVIPVAMIALAGTGGIAWAQQSADSIINALKPSGNLVTGSTRGIKLGGSAAPQAAPSSARLVRYRRRRRPLGPRAPVGASTSTAGPSVNLTVNFPTGSADLTPTTRASLDALGKALASSDLANFRFRIEGHTDNVGSREENLALSQKRAEAVVSYLASQYKVAPDRLQAVGMGQEQPLVQTPPAKRRRHATGGFRVINLGA